MIQKISFRNRIFLIIIVVTQFLLLVSSGFTVWPEMIIYPYLMNNGYLLYKDITNPYFPLLSIILDLYFRVVGVSVLNLKIFTYVTIFFINIVVFKLALNLSNSFIKAFFSLMVFIILNFSFGGNGLWFELFLAPFLVLSLFLVFQKKKKVGFVVGVLMLISILIKQNVALFLVPVIGLLIYQKRLKDLGNFIVTGVIGVLLLFGYLYSLNLFDDFFYWALQLPITYTSQPGFVLLPSKRQLLLIIFLFLPLLGFCLNKQIPTFKKVYWVLCFIIAGMFAFPRYEDFHLQLLIVLSAIFTIYLNWKLITFFIIGSLLIFLRTFDRLWLSTDRFIDKTTLSLVDEVKECDKLYLLNSPDLVYFFAKKLPPKPWAINFPWYFELKGFEEKFVMNLKKEQTACILVGDKVGGNEYDLGNYYPKKLYEYVTSNYVVSKRINNFNLWKIKNE